MKTTVILLCLWSMIFGVNCLLFWGWLNLGHVSFEAIAGMVVSVGWIMLDADKMLR